MTSRSGSKDAGCQAKPRIGILRHEALTLLGLVCGSTCQGAGGWAECMKSLHSAGVVSAALEVALAYPTANLVQCKASEMVIGILEGGRETAEEEVPGWGGFLVSLLLELGLLGER